MKKSTYFILSAAILLVAFSSITSCNKDKTEIVVIVPEDCPETIFFASFVEPLISTNCSTSGCHDAATAQSGYNLEGHGNISTHADIILTEIKHQGNSSGMPLGQPKFNDSIIEKVECWIDQGKLDN